MSRQSKVLFFRTLLVTSCLSIACVVCAQVAPEPGGSSSLPSPGRSAPQTTVDPATKNNELQRLEKQILLQQQEITELRAALNKQQELLQRLVEPPLKSVQFQPLHPRAQKADVQPSPGTGQKPSRQPVASVEAMSAASNPILQAVPPDHMELQPQRNPAIPNSPITPIPLKIGDATITPVGFVDATEFFRTKNLGSGIGASFGSIPFSDTVQGRLTENRFTIQNSRIGLQFDDEFGGNKVRGYLETDFLGLQPDNAFVTSNSHSLRLRLYWVNLTRGKFEFLAGQSWSLLTPGRIGISPMPSDIFYTQDMDTNYQVGLTWARQLQFRFVYHPSPIVTAALSLENSEQYVGTAVVLPSNFNPGQVSTGAGTSTPNLAPDVIGKVAFDPYIAGRRTHFELAGLLSEFRTYSPTLNRTSTATGAGGSFNFNMELFKNFDLVESSFYSDGGGRYIFGLGPDFVVRPDGTPSPVRSASGITGFEYQATPKVMFYGYYGGAYFGRNYSVIPSATGVAPTYVGYGFPGSSSSANRAIQEGTFGVIQTFWKNPRHGALQLITQYSYLTRAPWWVKPGSPKNAHLSQAYADIRYVLP